MPKILVSRSGEAPEWRNSRRLECLERLDADAVTDVKRDGDGYLVVYGSLSVVARLQELNMIDEYHLLVHPTAIGEGKALFAPAQSPVRLRLHSAEPFSSGVVLMRYRATAESPARDEPTRGA